MIHGREVRNSYTSDKDDQLTQKRISSVAEKTKGGQVHQNKRQVNVRQESRSP